MIMVEVCEQVKQIIFCKHHEIMEILTYMRDGNHLEKSIFGFWSTIKF